MNLLPRKFYDVVLPENGGGASDIQTEEIPAAQAAHIEDIPEAPQTEVKAQILSDDELKGFGFDSAEALKNFLKEQKDKNAPDEEKQEKENLDKANFIKFSAENKLLKVDEYNQYETLKSKSDTDLVFEKFKAEYKEDHPEFENEDELKEAAKEEFDYEYKINSQSEAAKKRGEAKLAKEAKELRSPFESKVNDARSQYDDNKKIRDNYPKFEKFVDESIIKNTPDKFVAFKAKEGEEEIDIEIELTKEDREAIAKAFKTPKTYQLFSQGKPEEIQAKIDSKIQGWVKANKSEQIAARSYEIGKGISLKEGSKVGAQNPFPLSKSGASDSSSVDTETLEQSNARLAEIRKQYSYRK